MTYSVLPEPPLAGDPVPVRTSPFWIGSDPASDLRVVHPEVAARHVALIEREDGLWLSAAAPTRHRGEFLGAPRLLRSGDVLSLAPGVSFRFHDADAPATVVAARAAAPVLSPSAPRRRPRRRVDLRSIPYGILVATVLGVAILAGVGAYAWHVLRAPTPALLSDAEAAAYDSLLSISLEHIERGSALLDAGVGDAALDEFVQGVNVLATSPLREHRYVRPRIEALQASVAAAYRSKRLAVPAAYRSARASGSPVASTLRASLSRSEFLAAFESVQQAFEARFGRRPVVTGADHAEHLSLYGTSGALDIRTKDLNDDQVSFLVEEFLRRRIRVKDFSRDDVLQRQIAAAIKAGLGDRAGTGVHLHIDRFATRRDRWTVSSQ